MSVGTRFGAMLGMVLGTAVICLIYEYRPHILGEMSPLLVAAVPALVWLAIELAGWLRHRIRWLSRIFLLLALVAGAGWWLWLYGLFTWGHVATRTRIGVPSVLVGAYLAALLIGTWRASRRTGAMNEPQTAKQAELVSQ